jgi:hypothetical protein
MADNKTLPDASGVAFTVRTKDNAGVNLPCHGVVDAAGVNISAVDVNGRVQITTEGSRATYRYCLVSFSMVATPTDVIVIQGSGTKTVNIKRIKVSGQATSQGAMPVQLVKRSSSGTLGSAVLTPIPTPAKHDSGDPAPTATISSVGTANISVLGTSLGILAVDRLGLSTLSTGNAGPAQDVTWDFALRNDKPIKLRGVAEFLCVNFNGAAIPSGGVVDFEIETEEDAS